MVESVSAMEKGDLYVVDLSAGSASIDFSSASGDAEFQLVVQSKKTSAGSASVSVASLASDGSRSARISEGGNGGLEKPGAGRISEGGNGGLEKPGASHIFEGGNGGLEKPGATSIFEGGNGGLEKPGATRIFEGGNGGLEKPGTVRFSKSINDAYPTDLLQAQEYVDATLREIEQTLEGAPVTADRSVSKANGSSLTVGDTDTFRVLSSLSTTTTYETVNATVRCIGEVSTGVNVALWVDDTVRDAFTDEQITTLCAQYEAALATEFAILGEPPDINANGAVEVLATKVVNEIGGSLGGIVTGFFFGGDLLARSSVSKATNPASNEREIVYTLVPDPSGEYGTAIPVDFAMENLLTAVVPHEMQHMVSYYSHAIDHGKSAEASWLNEALSHLVEDVVGYGQENPSRMELFLASSYDTALIPSGSPGLAERGASYSFLRFLYEQADDSETFLHALVRSESTGASNVVESFAGPFSTFDEWSEFLLRWGVAMAVTDQNVTSDTRYTYQSRTADATTGHWLGVCMVCDADDGRGTQLVGPTLLDVDTDDTVAIDSGGNAIYDLSSPPSTLTVETTSTDLQGVLIRTN